MRRAQLRLSSFPFNLFLKTMDDDRSFSFVHPAAPFEEEFQRRITALRRELKDTFLSFYLSGWRPRSIWSKG